MFDFPGQKKSLINLRLFYFIKISLEFIPSITFILFALYKALSDFFKSSYLIPKLKHKSVTGNPHLLLVFKP